jgi:HSP20 family protein
MRFDPLSLMPRFFGLDDSSLTPEAWSPRVDISEHDKAFVLAVDLPGVKKEDLKVHVEEGLLTIAGQRLTQKKFETERVHRSERVFGSFSRQFQLPENVDNESIDAQFKDGVLTVEIRKAPQAQPRSIEVKVN